MKKTKDFKVEIGTIFKDKKRDITIIDKDREEDKNGRMWKIYKYRCNRCGWENGWIRENNLLEGKGCRCCANQIVVKGINDIATTAPWMIEYFVDEEDGYKYTKTSGQKILCECPNCKTKKKIIISNLYSKKFSCQICGDGISYPEKVMNNVLQQLKEDNQLRDFNWQLTKRKEIWCDKYRYDFSFELDCEKYIIETHGIQHYKNSTDFKISLEQTQENDKYKKELAIANKIKEENYIVIDCRYSNIDFIEKNIFKSRLNEIFDLSIINWHKIEINSEKTKVKEICDYWHLHNEINNENLTTKDIANLFKLNYTTIQEYLKRGTKLKWCYYNGQEEMKKIKSKRIEIFKDGESLGVFLSITELAKQSINLFNIELNIQGISKAVRGKIKTHNGFTFKYVESNKIKKEEI